MRVVFCGDDNCVTSQATMTGTSRHVSSAVNCDAHSTPGLVVEVVRYADNDHVFGEE